jgi:triphosphoribosyl-dephospho-CoA synthetase
MELKMIYCIAIPAAIAFGSVCYALGKFHARRSSRYANKIIAAIRTLTWEDIERYYPEAATELEKDLNAAFRREGVKL